MIADLGCGIGNFLWLLKGHGFQNIIGIENDPIQAKKAQQIAPVTYSEVNDWLQNYSNHFDALFALDFIEHLEPKKAVFFVEKCFHALKPKGRLVIQTPNAFALRPTCALGDSSHQTIFSPKEIFQIFKHTGFSEIQIKECRPTDPRPIKGKIRTLLWETIRFFVKRVDIIEAFDDQSSNILTRNMLVSGIKKTF